MVHKVSIIIPAYNASKYIHRCLDSVARQDYTDYEVLVVDDNSTDNTSAIVNELKESDNRIRLFKNPKKGVSSARNYGILVSKGEYITFLDSDDELSPSFLKTLVTISESEESDCVAVSYTSRKEDLQTKIYDRIDYYRVAEKYSLVTGISSGAGGYVWNKLYKSSIIKNNGICFQENFATGEDLLFNVAYLSFCQRVVYCQAKLYYYALNSNSAVNKLNNPRWFDMLYVYKSIIERNIRGASGTAFSYNYALLIMEALYRLKFCDEAPFNKYELIELKKRYVKISRQFSIKQNIKLVLLKYFTNISMKYRRRAIE